MQVGIDSFARLDFGRGKTYEQASRNAIDDLIQKIVYADKVGLDLFGVGEHHRKEFADSAPTIILAAAARATTNIRLTSAVTVLSAVDPVRAFQEFATLDLISGGRVEMIIGRGSFIEAFPLFGYDLSDYDEIFVEKTELLLKIRDEIAPKWSGRFRPALDGVPIYPRPLQSPLPIWVGVGGTPSSFYRAGLLGLPLMVAIIGGETYRFRKLIDLYKLGGEKGGHSDKLKVGLHSIGYVGETMQDAADDFYPGYEDLINRMGREKGFATVTRTDYNTQLGKYGALLIGSAEDVAEKIERHSKALGGLDRVTFQMDGGMLPLEKNLRSIELISKVKALLS